MNIQGERWWSEGGELREGEQMMEFVADDDGYQFNESS